MVPSLKALRALSVIAAEGTFERAAQRLDISRSAVSHLIADLERQLGVRLLERNARGVKVTEDGKGLLASIGDSIQRIDSAVDAFRRDRNRIRLSTVATFATCWLLPRVPDFQSRHRHLQLSILTTNRAVDFAVEDFDCGIRHGTGPWLNLECTLLFREALVLVGLPALAAKLRHDDLATSLRAIPIIQARTRPHDLPQWWQGVGLEGAVPRSSLIVENRAQALTAAAAGAGMTLIDPPFIEPPSPMSNLVRLLDKVVPLPFGYFFVVPERNRSRRSIILLASWLASDALGPRKNQTRR